MKRWLLVFAAMLLAAIVWSLWPRHDVAEDNAAAAPTSSRIENSKPKTPTPAVAEVSHVADNLNAPTGDIRADLRIVGDLLQNFRTNFPHDGNPVGSNAEITAMLAGKNKRRIPLIAPNHPAINRDGELCDRWGTPFFFHAESGTRMTIRSAGPDKKMWTEDDVEFSP